MFIFFEYMLCENCFSWLEMVIVEIFGVFVMFFMGKVVVSILENGVFLCK